MEKRRIPMDEWRSMSDEDQRAVIRSGYTPYEDLPPGIRAEVDEMLANSRPFPFSNGAAADSR